MFVAKCSKLNVSVFLLCDDLKRLFVIEASVTKLHCCEVFLHFKQHRSTDIKMI